MALAGAEPQSVSSRPGLPCRAGGPWSSGSRRWRVCRRSPGVRPGGCRSSWCRCRGRGWRARRWSTGRFWAKVGAQVGTVMPTMSPFDLQRGAEFDGLAEVGAEDLDRALGAQVVAGRVGAGDAPEDRQARLRRGAEEAVEEGALLVGRLRQGQGPGLDRAAVPDQEGRLGLAVADLEAGDAAHRLAGQLGAGGVGDRRGLSEHDAGGATLAALAPPARPIAIARELTASASDSRRPLRDTTAANAPCEDLDIHLLLSLKALPVQGRLATLAAEERAGPQCLTSARARFIATA